MKKIIIICRHQCWLQKIDETNVRGIKNSFTENSRKKYLKACEEADEEAVLIHQLERLEVEEEIEKEDDDLMEIEEIAGPSNSSSTPKKKTTQSQITSFFVKKRYANKSEKNKKFIALIIQTGPISGKRLVSDFPENVPNSKSADSEGYL